MMSSDITADANRLRGSSGNRGSGGSNLRGKSAGEIIPKGYSKGRLSNFDENQTQLYNQAFSHLGPDSYLSRLAGGDESLFEEIEAPAWRDFQAAQGQLGSRFSQLAPGAMSAQRGSGFQQAGGQLSSNFAQDLQANRQNLMQQAVRDLMGYSQMLLGQKPYEQGFFEKPQKQQNDWLGFAGDLVGTVAPYALDYFLPGSGTATKMVSGAISNR